MRALNANPGVLGYEIINEPWPAGRHDFLSDAKDLLPMYKSVVARIRSVDSSHLVFFEPLVLDSYAAVAGHKTDFPAGACSRV